MEDVTPAPKPQKGRGSGELDLKPRPAPPMACPMAVPVCDRNWMPSIVRAVIERTVVSRHDWLHGLVPCPQCGLPLAVDRDLVKERARAASVSARRRSPTLTTASPACATSTSSVT